MITMGGFSLPAKTIREMIVSAVDVVVQAQRLRDGSRRIVSVTEIIGMEGDVVIAQEVLSYEIFGEDAKGKLVGLHKPGEVGIPKFMEKARYYGLGDKLSEAMEELNDIYAREKPGALARVVR